jgi:type II secretory ATPase GspE/PulE/Tfp pilus assembly ATPase PilB-like protein
MRAPVRLLAAGGRGIGRRPPRCNQDGYRGRVNICNVVRAHNEADAVPVS